MSLSNSPGIVTNGLVYLHDVNNIKSYSGPAIQNLAKSITPGSSSGTGYVITAGSEVVNIPQLGNVSVGYTLIQNNYPAVSTNCCPSPITYNSSGSITVSPSTLYTYAIVYKCDSGYTHPNYMYRYEFNGTTYVTEGGIFSTSNRIHLGSGWYWAWGTFTTNASTNTLFSIGAFYYQYSTGSDKLSIAKVLLTPGNFTGLHPKYWPSLNSSRTATQVISDIANTNSLTVSGLVYGTDGSITYNGSSSITLPNTSSYSFANEQTIIIWMKNSSTAVARRNPYNQSYGGFGTITHESDTFFNYFYGNAGRNNTPYTNHSSPFTVIVNETAMIAITRSPTQTSWYKNGALGNTQANPYGVLLTDTNDIFLGTGYAGGFMGSLYIVAIYNRALSAAEIQQNFNAMRGRFGL